MHYFAHVFAIVPGPLNVRVIICSVKQTRVTIGACPLNKKGDFNMQRTKEEREKLYADIMSLKAQSLRNQEIALKLGVSDNTVSRYVNGYVGVRLADYGLDTRRKLTAKEIEEIKQRYADGEKGIDLAREFDVHQSTITYYCNPGRKERVNQNVMNRIERLKKEDPEFRERLNEQVTRSLIRRRKIIDKIKKGEITK